MGKVCENGEEDSATPVDESRPAIDAINVEEVDMGRDGLQNPTDDVNPHFPVETKPEMTGSRSLPAILSSKSLASADRSSWQPIETEEDAKEIPGETSGLEDALISSYSFASDFAPQKGRKGRAEAKKGVRGAEHKNLADISEAEMDPLGEVVLNNLGKMVEPDKYCGLQQPAAEKFKSLRESQEGAGSSGEQIATSDNLMEEGLHEDIETGMYMCINSIWLSFRKSDHFTHFSFLFPFFK